MFFNILVIVWESMQSIKMEEKRKKYELSMFARRARSEDKVGLLNEPKAKQGREKSKFRILHVCLTRERELQAKQSRKFQSPNFSIFTKRALVSRHRRKTEPKLPNFA